MHLAQFPRFASQIRQQQQQKQRRARAPVLRGVTDQSLGPRFPGQAQAIEPSGGRYRAQVHRLTRSTSALFPSVAPRPPPHLLPSVEARPVFIVIDLAAVRLTEKK